MKGIGKNKINYINALKQDEINAPEFFECMRLR